jgi:hypothetical protein
VEPVTWGFLGTIVGTLAGASASILTTIIAEGNRHRIKSDEAAFIREEKTREFQCNNLLKLQDVISSTMRLVARAHLEDISNFRERRLESTAPMLSKELNNEILSSNRELAMLSERISDDQLRENIKLLRAKMTTVLIAKNEKESYDAFRNASSSCDESMADIGIVLRKIF